MLWRSWIRSFFRGCCFCLDTIRDHRTDRRAMHRPENPARVDASFDGDPSQHERFDSFKRIKPGGGAMQGESYRGYCRRLPADVYRSRGRVSQISPMVSFGDGKTYSEIAISTTFVS